MVEAGQRAHVPRVLVAEEEATLLEARTAERQGQHLAEFLDEVDLHALARLLRQVLEIGLVLLREDDLGDAGAQGAEDYFANTRTGLGGAFEFAGVPKGTLTLRATAGDLILGSSRTAVKEVRIPEGQAEVSAEIVFEDGLSISGTVMRRGAPVVGARVAAFMSGTGRQASR